ncbi:MAG: 16S rRNA (guanine(527)-N(7))-methyltransferase RsmG [Burkholderiaceae bacterium]|nr:16S rRNA (guanine(527)-N(7))-methyltransferase RsmG [Burkholderiaceae bacterium]
MQNEKVKQLTQLENACEALSLLATENQKNQLLEYLTQLLKWNHTYNLTAIRDPEQALIQHVFDSLAVIKPISEYFLEQHIKQATILDVGSGAGLPAVILGIMIPTSQICCVDPVDKKMTFVRQAVGILKLSNVEAVHSRVEHLETGPYDMVISRAFASLEDFAQLAGNKVKSKGLLLAMKGKHPQEEIECLEKKTRWMVEKVEPVKVPQLDAQRCLVWMKDNGTK